MGTPKKIEGPTGDAPRKRRHKDAVEANRPHQFQSSDPRCMPSWLNAGSQGGRTCSVCGVKEIPPGSLTKNLSGNINADHAGFGDEGKRLLEGKKKVQMWTYEDAKGNTFTSQKQLGCPVFVLDHLGTTMENRAMLREVDDRVDSTEDRVDSVEARLARLEAENGVLREQIAQGPVIDAVALIEGLRELAKMVKANQEPTRLLEDNRVTIDIGEFEIREREVVLVHAHEDEESSG